MNKIFLAIGLFFASMCVLAAPPKGFTLIGKNAAGITWAIDVKSIHELDLHVGKQPLPIVVFRVYVERDGKGGQGYIAANCDVRNELWVASDPEYDYSDNDLDNHGIVRKVGEPGTLHSNAWFLVCTLNNMKALENGLDKTFPQDGKK